MRILLDTHCWLWSLVTPEKMADDALAHLQDGANDVHVSAATIWELAVKVSIGKLAIPEPLDVFVSRRIAAQGILGLPVSLAHAVRVESLPRHHRDPFDRMLVAQAQAEDLALMTADRQLAACDVDIAWAGRDPAPR